MIFMWALMRLSRIIESPPTSIQTMGRLVESSSTDVLMGGKLPARLTQPTRGSINASNAIITITRLIAIQNKIEAKIQQTLEISNNITARALLHHSDKCY